jgi:hypothetical protein
MSGAAGSSPLPCGRGAGVRVCGSKVKHDPSRSPPPGPSLTRLLRSHPLPLGRGRRRVTTMTAIGRGFPIRRRFRDRAKAARKPATATRPRPSPPSRLTPMTMDFRMPSRSPPSAKASPPPSWLVGCCASLAWPERLRCLPPGATRRCSPRYRIPRPRETGPRWGGYRSTFAARLHRCASWPDGRRGSRRGTASAGGCGLRPIKKPPRHPLRE